MKSECCHQHPDNGSDLAMQTEAQAEETDLRAVNAKLLSALEGTLPALDSAWERAIMDTDAPTPAKLATIEEGSPVSNKAREAIEEAKK
jgi:hypothetical protein